jgi:hypothetical protein
LQADASLAEVHALQHLPHFLYSLLHGPLLQAPGASLAAAAAPPGASQWQHPDRAAAMRALLRVLPPDELAVAVCPQLSSWASPEEVAVLHHSLSAAALAVSQQPIWVLDTFLQLVVLYRGSTSSSNATAAGAQPPQFPPPAASLLRRTLAGIRQVRRATPELLMLRQGVDDTAAFNAWLIEDAPPAAAGAADQWQQQQRGRGDEEGQQQQLQQQHQLQWPSFVAFLNAAGSQAQQLLEADR